jgi:chemotaxis protein MotB
MSRPSNSARPVIVQRAPDTRPHGHHGGAWKVAYADFVTAMMAFFLLLWLVGSADKDTLKGLAEFFSDAKVNVGPPGGTGGILDGFSVVPADPGGVPASPFDQPSVLPGSPDPGHAGADELDPGALAPPLGGQAARDAAPRTAQDDGDALDGLEAAQDSLAEAFAAAPELRRFADSMVVDQTPEGLRIQLVDREQLAMFPVGSATMYAHTRRMLELVVKAIAPLPNPISIRGHTDALPFAPGAEQDNWSLSSDRANATRRAMTEAGLDPGRVAEVVGRGDADPLLPTDAHDPRNRRISIVLLRTRPGGPPGPATGARETGGGPRFPDGAVAP